MTSPEIRRRSRCGVDAIVRLHGHPGDHEPWVGMCRYITWTTIRARGSGQLTSTRWSSAATTLHEEQDLPRGSRVDVGADEGRRRACCRSTAPLPATAIRSGRPRTRTAAPAHREGIRATGLPLALGRSLARGRGKTTGLPPMFTDGRSVIRARTVRSVLGPAVLARSPQQQPGHSWGQVGHDPGQGRPNRSNALTLIGTNGATTRIVTVRTLAQSA